MFAGHISEATISASKTVVPLTTILRHAAAFVDHTGNRGCSIVYPRPVFERFDVTPSNDTDVCVEFKLILPELLPPSLLEL